MLPNNGTEKMLDALLARADALCDALATEIERLRDAGNALASLASERIYAHARAREEFNRALARHQDELAAALEEVRAELQLPEMTLPLLTAAAPTHAHEITAVFARIRVLAARLEERDKQLKEMLEKGLALVSGYLAAVRPPTQAYDRRGAVTERQEAPASTISWRG